MSRLLDIYKDVFPTRLKQMRKEKGLTQSALGEKIGIDRQTVNAWENGKSTPNIQQLAALCDISGYDTGYFMGEYSSKKNLTSDLVSMTGMSETAADELLIMVKNGDPCIETLSSLITEHTLISQLQISISEDYGHISQIFDDIDPFTKKRISFKITPRIIRQSNVMEAYRLMVNFVNSERHKKGFSGIDEI